MVNIMVLIMVNIMATRKRRSKKISILFLSLILSLSLSACEKKTTGETNKEEIKEIEVIELEQEELKEPKVYALFGVDSRNNAYGVGTRSDTIMLISVDDQSKTIKVASILRDTLFHIEDRGYEKVTHAHSYGGPKLAVSTINENLDLNIEKYLTVNFNSFKELVDEIGGIEIELEYNEIYNSKYPLNDIDGKYTGYISVPGTYLLDGEQALMYSRNRNTDGGDVKRSERQREVLFAIFEKAKTISLDSKLRIATLMLNTINTNLDNDEALSLIRTIENYKIEEMVSYPQIFYAGLISYSYGNRYVEIPFYLEDMAKDIHNYLGLSYDGASETLMKHSDYISSLVDGPNTDTTESYGNYVNMEVNNSYE